MKKRITNKLMMTFLLGTICLLASNVALSQTQAVLWLGARPANSSTNTNRSFDTAQTADISRRSSENLNDNSAVDSTDAKVSQRESIYSSLINFLFDFVN